MRVMRSIGERYSKKLICAACGKEVEVSLSGEVDREIWPFVAEYAGMKPIFNRKKDMDPTLGCEGECFEQLTTRKRAA